MLGDEFAYVSELHEVPSLAALSVADIEESAQILEKQGYVRIDGYGDDTLLRLTTDGFRRFGEAGIPGYKATLNTLSGLIVNEGVSSNTQLAERSGQPQRIVNWMLDVLAAAEHIMLSKYGNGLWEIAYVAPSLKRALE